MSLLAELRQRKLVRWALAYAAVAFAVVQGGDLIAVKFGWPDSVGRVLIIAAFVGFFVTLLLAWYHGERGAQKASGTELALIALLLVIGGGLAWKFGPSKGEKGSEPGTAVSTKSIAVLPFADLSPTKDQEYFSDGIAEEILNALARVKDLKVAGRTSSFSFKGKQQDLRSMGQALGVANILEGSVRKQGEKVRITAQLVRTEDGFHRWSEQYDGDLNDVFELQERIARAITDELKVILQGDQKTRLVAAGTSNTEAYALYLQATAIFNRRDGDHFPEAIAALQEAIRLDPAYARAHSRLAALHAVLPSYAEMKVGEAHAKVMQSAYAASALDPTLAEPYAALGLSHGKFPDGQVAAFEAFDRAMQLDPDDPATNFWYGLSLCKTDYRERGTKLIDRTLALDPLLPIAWRLRGMLHFHSGDVERAESMFRRARALGQPAADFSLAKVAALRGDRAVAAKLWFDGTQGTFRDVTPEDRQLIAQGIYGDAPARERALALIESYLAKPQEHVSHLFADALFSMDQPARALNVMHTRQLTGTADTHILLWSRDGRGMRALPEFDAFIRDHGFVALWDRYGAPDDCRKNGKGSYVCD